jgi:hypothetical protein
MRLEVASVEGGIYTRPIKSGLAWVCLSILSHKDSGRQVFSKAVMAGESGFAT